MKIRAMKRRYYAGTRRLFWRGRYYRLSRSAMLILRLRFRRQYPGIVAKA